MIGHALFDKRRYAVLIALAALFMLQGCERAKTKLDREVDRLCAIDGGVRVYESVKLPKENFGVEGIPSGQFKQGISRSGNSKWSSIYRSETSVDLLHESRQIELIRTHATLKKFRLYVFRLSDGKLLGETITYVRGGGDFFGPWADSSYECPKRLIDPVDAIFVKGE